MASANGDQVDGACDTGRLCQGVPPGCMGCEGICSNGGVGASLALTDADKEGAVRTAEVEFDIQEHLAASLGEHVTVFAAAHPNCHSGYQGIVSRDGPSGNYFVQALFSDAAPEGHEDEFPECGQEGVAFGDAEVVALSPDTALPLDSKIKISTTPSGSTIVMGATFTDLRNNQMTSSVGQTPKPIWYNAADQGQRFAFGSINDNPAKPTRFDNFLATYEAGGGC